MKSERSSCFAGLPRDEPWVNREILKPPSGLYPPSPESLMALEMKQSHLNKNDMRRHFVHLPPETELALWSGQPVKVEATYMNIYISIWHKSLGGGRRRQQAWRGAQRCILMRVDVLPRWRASRNAHVSPARRVSVCKI